MAQMTTKRSISEDQDPICDSGFDSAAPDCALKCEPKGLLISKWLICCLKFSKKPTQKFDKFLP